MMPAKHAQHAATSTIKLVFTPTCLITSNYMLRPAVTSCQIISHHTHTNTDIFHHVRAHARDLRLTSHGPHDPRTEAENQTEVLVLKNLCFCESQSAH